jgi:putative ABC transport system permease protein
MAARYLRIFLISFRVLWRHPFRSGLILLMAALGVIGVVCSVNYGASGSRQILDQIRRMGANVLIVTPAESRAVAGRARTGAAVTTLVEADYLSIRKALPSLVRSSALVNASLWIKAGDLSKNATVAGVEPDYFSIKNWPMAAGNPFSQADQRISARLAILGHTAAGDLFGKAPAIGQHLMINRVPFLVVGVLTERGQGLDVSNEDNQIYVPLTTAMRRLMNVDHYGAIVLEIASIESMKTAAQEASSLLRSRHHIQQNRSNDFQIQNQRALLDTQMATALRLNFFLRWIAASALTVSGLGIVAITWIALKERTREFGARRALGATRHDVFLQVLFEAATLAVAGSILGAGLSWTLSRLVSTAAGLPFVFEREAAGLAVSTAVALNLAFCLLPSRKTAALSPLEALRYE